MPENFQARFCPLTVSHRHCSKSFHRPKLAPPQKNPPPRLCRGSHANAMAKHATNIRQEKRHININFLVRLLLGHPGNVTGTNRVCPRDKVGFSQGQTQVFFYTAEAQFVPGTNPVCPWDIPGTKGGRQSLCVKSLCAFFVPYNKMATLCSVSCPAQDTNLP